MFLPRRNADIPDDEWENIMVPYLDLFDEYVATYIAPCVASYYIATGYYRSAIAEESFEVLLRSSLDTINFSDIDRKLKNRVKKIMRLQYQLKVIEEEPILKVEELKKRTSNR